MDLTAVFEKGFMFEAMNIFMNRTFGSTLSEILFAK